MEDQPNKKKSFKNPKKLIIIIVIIVLVALLTLGGIFFVFNQQIPISSVTTKTTVKKIDEASIKKVSEYQFYGQPLDSQNIGRLDPFQPY